MSMIGRSSLRRILPFAPLLAAAALSMAVAITEQDVAAPGDTMRGPTDATTLQPVRGSAHTIRVVEVDGAVSGYEADPDGFDRVGLERWWRNYQLSHSLRAENSKK